MTKPNIDTTSINTIRFLSVDAIEKAQSGHPGMPMGAAPMAYVLWQRILKHNPKNPGWYNRDRFVLSAGHGSMLLYSLLHLSGYESPTLADIKNFRQWGSKTPGHPENTITPAVEVTTGPLGQGFANGVGLALSERHMGARFNKPGFGLVDHFTYCMVGDGCLMEGISSEAASMAGHLGLGKLIVLYDDNGISIDGSTKLAFTEDVTGRFEAFGWQVLEVKNGNDDLDGIEAALNTAKATGDKPSLIRVHTTIGYGAPNKQNTAGCHGSPLGGDEQQKAKDALGWTYDAFEIPAEVIEHMQQGVSRGIAAETQWDELAKGYAAAHPEEMSMFTQQCKGAMPPNWEASLPAYSPKDNAAATRLLSGVALNAVAEQFPGVIGGSADLTPSNQTLITSSGDLQKETPQNRNLRFGVREHAMGAICNGMALHGSGLIPYSATYLVFADYMRNAIRMAALSKAGTLFVFTHDSVVVGEDGPTHQPVEHLASLRLIPGLTVLRPADGNEVSGAYKVIVGRRDRPAALILARQSLPQLENSSMDAVAKGGYIVHDCEETPEIILMGTGSEVFLCVAAAKKLSEEGIAARAVSMPALDLFKAQPQEYKDAILPSRVRKRLAVEAGCETGWGRLIGDEGDMISIDDFGHSAPGDVCLRKHGYTVENVVARAKALLN